MSRRVMILACLVAGLLMATVAAGCAEPPATREARRVRKGAFSRDIEGIVDLENYRVPNLKATGDLIQDDIHYRDKAFRRDLEGGRDLANEDIKWWQHRQQDYRDALKREAKGNPEAIETVLPRLVY